MNDFLDSLFPTKLATPRISLLTLTNTNNDYREMKHIKHRAEFGSFTFLKSLNQYETNLIRRSQNELKFLDFVVVEKNSK